MIDLKRVTAASLLVLGVCVGFAAMGCDKKDPCTAYCDKDLTCLPPMPPDTTAIPKCIQSCQDLAAKDAAYQTAIEATASCYSSTSCLDIRAGSCVGAT
jgi:hypothetical protein